MIGAVVSKRNIPEINTDDGAFRMCIREAGESFSKMINKLPSS